MGDAWTNDYKNSVKRIVDERDVLLNDRDNLWEQVKDLKAQCAAMRSLIAKMAWYMDGERGMRCRMCKEHVEDAHKEDCDIQKALSTDAGKELLERLRLAESNAKINKDLYEQAVYRIADYERRLRKLEAVAEAAKDLWEVAKEHDDDPYKDGYVIVPWREYQSLAKALDALEKP